MEQELIQLNQLSMNYGHKQALNDVSLTLTANKIVGLLGPNGA